MRKEKTNYKPWIKSINYLLTANFDILRMSYTRVTYAISSLLFIIIRVIYRYSVHVAPETKLEKPPTMSNVTNMFLTFPT